MDGDIALVWNNNHASIALTDDGTDFLTDAGLETAVIVSLFTDLRASEHDELPATETDRRGWWGNTLQAPDDQIGSKLWLLRREKQLPAVMRRAEEYARDALRWMTKDGVARRVDVVATNPRTGWLLLTITIHKPDNTLFLRKYEYNWDSQEHRYAV